jgi:hypothetical protein
MMTPFHTDLQTMYMALMGLSKPEIEEKVFYKTTIIPDGAGRYRASITKFQNGNTDAIVETFSTISAAEKYITEYKNATNV